MCVYDTDIKTGFFLVEGKHSTSESATLCVSFSLIGLCMAANWTHAARERVRRLGSRKRIELGQVIG